MDNKFIQALQVKVENWRKDGYSGIEKESKNIIDYIKKIGYLHQPQLEAFETYVYLKEVIGNVVFTDLVKKVFDNEKDLVDLFDLTKDEIIDILYAKDRDQRIEKLITDKYNGIDYPNQIYALSMGTGKTILMGVMMLYDFTLSYYHKDDKRFAKNALVFAPDTTIIESLKEIKTFDYTKVLPKEYQQIVLNIKYHYLESPDTPLNPIGNYNVVVSNSQKIILKTKHKEDARLRLFRDESGLRAKAIENMRLRAIRTLSDLIVFVDEAHHSFGTTLEGTLKKSRETINFIHKEGKTPLVAAINLTGTPYINNKMLPNVVYHFGLKQGIEKGILKQVRFFEYGNVLTSEFIEDVADKFWNEYGEKRLEGKLPKIAFYAPSIDSLKEDLKPTLTSFLARKGIDSDKVLEYHTEAEENKEHFLVLDTENSTKQFVLLVGKGTEGWNCRSLVSCALYRKPKSSIFVLQSSTRCLRRIGDNTTKASIFLSSENARILDKELKNNFATSLDELRSQSQTSVEHELKVEKKTKITVKKVIREIISVQNTKGENIKIDLAKFNEERYKPYIYQSQITLDDRKTAKYAKVISNTKITTGMRLSFYEIAEIINRQTHLPCLEIETVLLNMFGSKKMVEQEINSKPGLIYFIVDGILSQAFEYNENVKTIDEELDLTKTYPFKISVDESHNKLVVYKQDIEDGRLGFHINPYNFDSKDELDLFRSLRQVLDDDEVIVDIFFTGGVVDPSHNDFNFEYYNPVNKRMARYFPDFLVATSKGRYLVIEVKSNREKSTYLQNKESYAIDGKVYDEVFAKSLGFEEFRKENKNFEYHIIFDQGLAQAQTELFAKIQIIKKD